jgi:hypothetical protein
MGAPVSASDLPDMRPDSGLAMAKVLVQTMHCDRAVAQRIKEDFDLAPCEQTIKAIRADYQNRRNRKPEPSRPCDAYRPWIAEAKAEEATAEFLYRLERERAYSAELARAKGALHSPLLTSQSLVDKALEREVEKARKALR